MTGMRAGEAKRLLMLWRKKYHLIPSSKVSEKPTIETPKIDATQGNIKEQVAETLRSILKHYKFCSLGEFNAILSTYNLTVEEIKTEFGERNTMDWSMFQLMNKGGKISTPINASDIGRGVGYTAVLNKMQKSKQAIKPLRSIIRYRVLQTMRTSPKTEEELRQRLEEQRLAYVYPKERKRANIWHHVH